MKVLSKAQIEKKIKRMAVEIIEHNHDQSKIYLAGINRNGLKLAKLLDQVINTRKELQTELINISLDPRNPVDSPIRINTNVEVLNDQVIVIVDDVANSGRTLFYAAKPFLSILPKKLEVAVLVDRSHKLFPVDPDYVGLSLATTARENIRIVLTDDEMEAYLE